MSPCAAASLNGTLRARIPAGAGIFVKPSTVTQGGGIRRWTVNACVTGGPSYKWQAAEMLVLNRSAAEARAQALRLGAVHDLVQACAVAICSSAQMRVHEGLDQFYDDCAREALVDAITFSDDASAEMFETNAFFDSAPEMSEATPETENLWEARTDCSIEARGDLTGSHDIESDRMFSGDKLNCYAKLMFAKAGRAGLVFMDAEGTAGVDESWREFDRNAEDAYMECPIVNNAAS